MIKRCETCFWFRRHNIKKLPVPQPKKRKFWIFEWIEEPDFASLAKAEISNVHAEYGVCGIFRQTQEKHINHLCGEWKVKKDVEHGVQWNEPNKQEPKWQCPIDHAGCVKNCGNYGCGN